VHELALQFAANGYYVFPRYNSSRGPQRPFGWARNTPKEAVPENKIIPASNDVEYVKIWPQLIKDGYNSTIHSYGVLGVGCLIIDLDVKDGKDGVNEFNLLRAKFKFPSPNLVVKSKSGGVHLYYKKPLSLISSELKTLASIVIDQVKYEGVDLRGDGGFVVGPSRSGKWAPGEYVISKGSPSDELSEAPADFISNFTRTTFSNTSDAGEALIGASSSVTTDVMSQLRMGEIPTSLPEGQRNEGFFSYISALRNKGFSKDTVKRMLPTLVAVTENKDTLFESIDIEEMLSRLFKVNMDNPYDVCRDLFNYGLYRLTGYKTKIHYTMISDNPYVRSRGIHDAASMKQLLCKYERMVPNKSGKDKLISPATLIDYLVPDDHDVDILAFKPGSGLAFTSGNKRALNIWLDPRARSTTSPDPAVWTEFTTLIERLFGPKESENFSLCLDFLAWVIQNPGIKPSIAPFIMSSKRGVGKSLFMSIMMKICGFNLMGETQARPFKINEISSRFFDPSRSALLIFDEVQFPVHRNMRQAASDFWMNLKNLITCDTYSVEIKGGDTFDVPNLGGVILAGNAGGHFPVEEFDRRMWIVDNNAPLLERGVCDTLFKARSDHSVEQIVIPTLITKLSKYKIVEDISSIRAPMTAIKQEMFMATLDRLSEWFMSHFDSPDNLLSRTPIITKSALLYLIETDPLLANTNYRDDPELAFREIRRANLIHPIRVKHNTNLSRSLQLLAISSTGDVYEETKRVVIYTTRDHGEYNTLESTALAQLYLQNIHTVKRWRENMVLASKGRQANLV